MKRRRRSCWLGCAFLALLILCPAVSSGMKVMEKGLTTNVTLMERTTSAAVDSLVRTLPFPLRGPVYLRAAVTHDATWMIENLFGGRLREKGVQVIVSAVPPVSIAQDTSAARAAGVGDSLVAAITPADTGTLTLEYRITELEMAYPRAWRPHYVGRKSVERVAIASLDARLIEESSGKLLWVGGGSAMKTDVVPASRLSFLEGKSQDWQKGTLPVGKLSAFVEPFVVAAIVGGLVYLFYSNKE